MRAFITSIHRYFGLPITLIIFWLGISGALLAFQDEIRERWIYPVPTIKINDSIQSIIPPSYIINSFLKKHRVENSLAQQYNVVYTTKEEPILLKVGSYKDKKGQSLHYFHPQTGQLCISYSTKDDPFVKIMQGHRYLWLSNKMLGKTIIGGSCILFIFLLLSGLWLFFPKKRTKYFLQKAFKLPLKIKNSKRTFFYRWHTIIGLFIIPTALIIGITGPTWSFPNYKNIYQFLFLNSSSLKKEVFFTKTYNIDKLFSLAQKYDIPVLKKGKTTIVWHFKEGGYLKYNPTFYTRSKEYSYYLNNKNKLKLIPQEQQLSFGEKIVRSTYDLHTGSIFGVIGHIIAFLTSLLTAVVALAAFLLYLQRKKTSRIKNISLKNIYKSLNLNYLCLKDNPKDSMP